MLLKPYILVSGELYKRYKLQTPITRKYIKASEYCSKCKYYSPPYFCNISSDKNFCDKRIKLFNILKKKPNYVYNIIA